MKRKRMFLAEIILSVLMLSLGSCGEDTPVPPTPEEKEIAFSNPVFTPTFADPTVVFNPDDNHFYAFGTQDYWGGIDHLISVVRSADLVKWTFVGDAFKQRLSWSPNALLWAPEVFVYDNKYFMFYSASVWGDSNPGIGQAFATSPLDQFTDLGKLFSSNEIGVQNSIDPCFFNDEATGKMYLFWGSFRGIFAVELNYANNQFEVASKLFQIAGDAFEGTMIHKRGDYYYLFVSAGSCCDGANSSYNMRVGRSKNVLGPYVDELGNDMIENGVVNGNLVLKSSGSATGYVGPGHNSRIVTDKEGTDWILYHAIKRDNPYLTAGGATRRPLMLGKVAWSNDWPSIGFGTPIVDYEVKPVF